MKKNLAPIAALAVCAAGLAVMGVTAQSRAKARKSGAEIPAENAETGIDAREKKAREILSRMGGRARSEISEAIIGDIKNFLAALDDALAADEPSAARDLPLLCLIDKSHPVPRDYEPAGLVKLERNDLFNINRNDLSLRPEAYDALLALARAAKADGVTLLVSSTYRSYDYQKTVYERWVKIDGQEEADRESARPGTSQHQLGCAIDFGSITDDFARTKMGKWLYARAAEFGWSLSFPLEYEDVTGYRWECWHFRYIGAKARALQKKYFNDVQQYMMEFICEWKGRAD